MPTKTPERVKSLRSQLATKAQEIEGLSSAWKDETGEGHFVISTEQKADYQRAVNDAQEIRELLATEEKAAGIFAYLDQPEGPSVGGTTAVQSQAQGLDIKSLGEAWIGSDEYKRMSESGFRNLGEIFEIKAGLPAIARASSLAEVKDVFSAMGGTIPNIPVIGRAQDLGWTERMLRPGRVRDLFAAERTDAAVLYGIRETGFTNRAATVPERTNSDGSQPADGSSTNVFGLKPRSEISLTSYTAPFATIAHIIYAHRQTLADEPRIRGIIDRDLIDGVKMVEDSQLLYGDGVGENLTGLVNTPGIQTYTGLSSDKRTAQIRRAMTRALLAWFQPSGVVLHPLDWENVELETDENGAYTVATSVATGGEKRVWRLNVVDSPAMNQGKFLLGAFGYGAKLYDREQVTIAVSTENRDMFERNAVTIRGEERIGLVVDRPESFVYGTFTTPA